MEVVVVEAVVVEIVVVSYSNHFREGMLLIEYLL